MNYFGARTSKTTSRSSPAITTIKFGGEWLHTLNDQVFRGFFTGRYIFDSVSGFLRYASPAAAGGFGPTVGECFNAAGAFTGWITQGAPFNQTCPAGSSVGGPLLLYLQNGIPTGIAGAAAARYIQHQERRLRSVRSGQMADPTKLHVELWSALGSSDFSRAGRTTQSNRLRLRC